MWILDGVESRRRRGYDVDIPRGRVAATPRPRREARRGRRYRDRHRNSKVDYETIEPHLERLYPRTFEWRCRVVNEEGSVVESVETHPLYGDLIDAAKYALDLATADERDPIFTRPVPDFRPGTHARRRSRKVHAFKHGAKSERNLDVDLLARSVSLEETKTEHSLTKVLTGRDFAASYQGSPGVHR